MKYVSLFAGIGGFDLALNRLGHECVYANEWDKYAAQTYEKNFKHKPDTRDITIVPTSEIPDHDLLVGGFPCQAFSIAGKRGGFNDTRGTLFFEVARILADKRPRYFVLENVKGLLSHDSGKTFSTILGVLTDLGYDTQWQVLNSKNFGVPQNRERVFIVGHFRGKPRPKIFPIGKNSQADIVLPTLTARYWGGKLMEAISVTSRNKSSEAVRETESMTQAVQVQQSQAKQEDSELKQDFTQSDNLSNSYKETKETLRVTTHSQLTEQIQEA